MDEIIKVTINGEEYTESQFESDIIRMFDSYRRDHMGSLRCDGVYCEDCPLNFNSEPCDDIKSKSFERIRIVYNWAKEHPVVTNRDKMIETFGGAYFNLIINYISDRALEDYDAWLNEEYKEPDQK